MDYRPDILNVAITQKCNFNCRYCFTTADENQRAEQFTLKDICKLLDEAKEIGITRVRLYGGEPLLHPDILLIIEAIYSRGLILHDIFTNGSLITEELIFTILKNSIMAPYIPHSHISYDGIEGIHNEFSQTKTNDVVLNNIKKLLSYGFDIKIHTVLCKTNEPYLKDTIKLFAYSGIQHMRVLKLMPSPRWQAYSKDTEYKTDKEWYEVVLKYTKWYSELTDISMDLEFWNTVWLYPKEKIIRMLPIKGCKDFNGDIDLACPIYETTISVDGDGKVLPCHQMGGIMKFEGVEFDNVKDVGLRAAIISKEYKDIMLLTCTDKRNEHNECKKCKYWDWCVGGCPLYGWRWRRDKGDRFPLYLDISKCEFFNNGYISKFKNAVPSDWYVEKGDFPWD